MSRVVSLFEQYVKLSNNLHYDAMIAAVRVDDPGKLADTIAAHLLIGVDEKQNLLEIISPLERLNRIAGILEIEVDKLQVDRKIQSRVKKQMEKAQKEYYLNEKMKAIQKELGRKDEKGNEVDELKKKIETSKMPKDVEEKAIQELKRLEAMPPMSAEATVSRNYLDWLIAVPWHKKSRESRDLKRAEEILHEDHYGLEKIKERILEFLAVRALVKKPKATILTFSGPPGVGKTSLAKSIARAMNRQFVRLSLGGVRDEAEIRGHRRTYIGAFPGQIIQMMKKAGTMNPVFLLDEVDKMSMDFRGDPSAALLEVLDPEQNATFLDHYLDVEYDLSNVMFICTANVLHTIPQALRDRMEVLQLAGYTEAEKVQIAKKFLAPEGDRERRPDQREHHLRRRVVRDDHPRYTREAGVRSLEREISSVCRKVARKVVSEGKSFKEEITADKVTQYLGVPRFRNTMAEEHNEIGVATGLAWTEVGGEILTTEATLMPGKGHLTLTGKLGDVMQESAQAAMSYVRSKAEEYGIPKDFNKRTDVHIHVPEGAIPKDGPSAGITLATTLVSALARVADPQGRRDDRRDHPARQGAADRRREGKGARRASRRHQEHHPAEGQREGSGGHSEERARHVERLLGPDDGRGSEDRAGRTAGGTPAGRGAGGTGRHRRRHDYPLRQGDSDQDSDCRFGEPSICITPSESASESREDRGELRSERRERSDLPRDGLAEIALVGRSNVGKSSLINALVRQRVARTSAAPGKTRLANVYRVTRGGGAPFYLLDLPGYGYARAPKGARGCGQSGRGAARRARPSSRRSCARCSAAAPAGLLLVDARHPGLDSDRAAWTWMREAAGTSAVVATKIDKLGRGERIRALRTFESVLETSVLPVSAVTGEGLDELWKLIDRTLNNSQHAQPPQHSRP